jgi:hypothetical protein
MTPSQLKALIARRAAAQSEGRQNNDENKSTLPILKEDTKYTRFRPTIGANAIVILQGNLGEAVNQSVVPKDTGKGREFNNWTDDFALTCGVYNYIGGDIMNPYNTKDYGSKMCAVPRCRSVSSKGYLVDNPHCYPVAPEYRNFRDPIREYFLSKYTELGFTSIFETGASKQVKDKYGDAFFKAYNVKPYRVMAVAPYTNDPNATIEAQLWMGVPYGVTGDYHSLRNEEGVAGLNPFGKLSHGSGLPAAIYNDMLQHPGEGIYVPGTLAIEAEDGKSVSLPVPFKGLTEALAYPYAVVTFMFDGQHYSNISIERISKADFARYDSAFMFAAENPIVEQIKFSTEEELEEALLIRHDDYAYAITGVRPSKSAVENMAKDALEVVAPTQEVVAEVTEVEVVKPAAIPPAPPKPPTRRVAVPVNVAAATAEDESIDL